MKQEHPYTLDDLFKMDHKNLQLFFNDLNNKLENDFYNLTADCSDPKTQSIIILKPKEITNKASKAVVIESYENTINTINRLNEKYNYPKTLNDDQTIIIIKEQQQKNKNVTTIRQVVPFNLWLSFALPESLKEPHLTQDGLINKINPNIHEYAAQLLTNWLGIPWLVYFQIQQNDEPLSPQKLHEHEFKDYKIILFNKSLILNFNLLNNKDQTSFNKFINKLKLPSFIEINDLNEQEQQYQLKINL